MSIVEGNANFNYPYTVVTGFACGSSNPSMNNSSTQAWTFFNNPLITLGPYYLFEVVNCPDAEGVYGSGATVPARGNEIGYSAIVDDMSTSGSPTRMCTSNRQ